MEGIFKEYYKRLNRNAILKSVCLSVIFGSGVNFLAAFIMLFCDLSVGVVLGLSIGAGVLAMGCAAPLLYHFKFKPTLKSMAAALDRQGLEERMVTMVELENDDSNIAKMQRENAVKKLENVNPKSLRFVLPTVAVVLISVAFILGVSMTTVSTLSAADIIQMPTENETETPPDDSDLPDDPEEEEKETVSVLYEAGEHGRVEGELFQEFEKGGTAKAVTAIPDEGYVFSFWSDGIFTAERQDQNVMTSFSVTAIFAKEVVPDEGEEGEGQEGGNEGSGQEGGSQQGSGGSGNGQEGEGGGDGEGEDGEGQGGGGASGSTAEDNNTVIDGTTDYHNEIDYDAAKDEILKDDTLSQEEKDMLLKYLATLMEDSKEN